MKINERAPGDRTDIPFVRNTIRPLLVFYDVLIYVVVYTLILGIYQGLMNGSVKITWPQALVQGLLCCGLVFCSRIIFKVYNYVLRFGNPGVYARLLAADSIGGAIYVLINSALPLGFKVTFPTALSIVITNLVACLLARLAYYYLFRAARRESTAGRAVAVFLRRFALVDARNEDGVGVMSFNQWLGRTEKIPDSPINDIQRVARQFQIVGDITDITQMNKGYINRTYRVRTLSKAGHVHTYTLQRINTNVFPDVDALMDNFRLVTEHLHDTFLLPGHAEKGSVQTVRLTRNSENYLRDDSGCWRMLYHFTGVYGMDIPDTPQTFYYAGRSFGKFIKCMSDMPVDSVKTIIPNFHNTYSRYLDLEKAIEQDPVGRLDDVWPEVNFIRERKNRFSIISDALESGRIPTRICHNDCNLNNILFSEKTGLPVAIIDLDTVMPGSPLYDYGDSMRIGTNTACDDEKDLSKVKCDLNLYQSYARGYLEECGDMLTREELELLPFSSLVITSEDGIRFLMDYINGDTYYNIFYPTQNLDRSRTQLKLLEDMENKLPRIRDILAGIYSDLKLDADPYRISFDQQK